MQNFGGMFAIQSVESVVSLFVVDEDDKNLFVNERINTSCWCDVGRMQVLVPEEQRDGGKKRHATVPPVKCRRRRSINKNTNRA